MSIGIFICFTDNINLHTISQCSLKRAEHTARDRMGSIYVEMIGFCANSVLVQ